MKILSLSILLLAGLGSPEASAQMLCFGPDMITATMCIAQKTEAIATMMKLQRDPRAGTWASEGPAGVRFVRREEAAMKAAMACMDLMSCTAANAMATAVASSIPNPVKGDLGFFANQIWQGAHLPKPGQELDELFDNKDPDLQPLHIVRSGTVSPQAAQSASALSEGLRRKGLDIAGDQMLRSAADTASALGSRAAALPAQRAAVQTGPQVPAADAATRWEQQPTAIHFDAADVALDLSQAAGLQLGSRGLADPDSIIGFAPSAGAAPPLLYSNSGTGLKDEAAEAAAQQVAKATKADNPKDAQKAKDAASDKAKDPEPL